MAYTPGVGRVSLALAAHPEDVAKLTVKGNAVAVVTDGSAVLGLGNIGPGAALPVMEGKAALFKRFADIDAWPICLDTQDTDEIVRIVQGISPGFGGINLEDISAPRCFEIETPAARARSTSRSSTTTSTAPRSSCLAALTNALRCVSKALRRRPHRRRRRRRGRHRDRHAAARRRRASTCSSGTARASSRPTTRRSTPAKRSLAALTNPAGVTGDLHDALRGADVFIGVSARRACSPAAWIVDMARDPIVFALANPDPEIDVDAAQHLAAVLATGRSDYPNQINNVLAFPGVFRGLLDARAREVTTAMLLSAADGPRALRHRRAAQRDLHRAVGVRPRRPDRGRGGGAGGGDRRTGRDRRVT